MPSPLRSAARLCTGKIYGCSDCQTSHIDCDAPVLVLLAAGKGTRFGRDPKCIQPINGRPLARHTIDAFRQFSAAPSICLIGYEAQQVSAALGEGNIFVLSDDFAGGTAMAAMEAFSVPDLERANPLVVVAMGDRIVPPAIFDELLRTHRADGEATLTLLTAHYAPPDHQGKGRIVRDVDGSITRIIEQPDIEAMADGPTRSALLNEHEANCPLYVTRAATLKEHLGNVVPCNAQRQYYFTDIVESIHRSGGKIRSVTIEANQPVYELICADVTRPDDLPTLQRALARYNASADQKSDCDVAAAAQRIAAGRTAVQSMSIAGQLQQLASVGSLEQLGFDPDEPIGIGVSGGRLRIAFMHPDMGRFFGPAWQMPIGAGNESGTEQIVVMVQASRDDLIRLHPSQPQFQESCSSVPANLTCMYPDDDIVDVYSYESFGTAMAQQLLSQLGYVTDRQLNQCAAAGNQTPDPSRWVSNAMRRPFALLANAIASMRTVRDGAIGWRVQNAIGAANFHGIKVASTGEIPQGGFSSSSAFTVAAINAIDALYDFQFNEDQKVQLACQSEYGTGVRAGALDQATEQKGQLRVGTLISSNPRENYRVLGTYEVPSDRFRVLFPYSVDRDSEAWKWSAGVYASSAGTSRLTAAEIRKMTGKSSELAAILTRLPLDVDYFQEIESDLVETGELTTSTMLHVRDRLSQIPIRIMQSELRESLLDQLPWYVAQRRRIDSSYSESSARQLFDALLSGWRDPSLLRGTPHGIREEIGAPLRAMVAYLYAEVAKNCQLIHNPDDWITLVARSQRGDRCFEIDVDALPSRQELVQELDWEKDVAGPRRLQRWMQFCHAMPFDYNCGIDDLSLVDDDWNLMSVAGTNFFRGLALIDLAEAMLLRAFGDNAVAVRINGAGQGDYFQVHVDTQLVSVDEVKEFIRRAFYRRFDLRPQQEFVEPHGGGGAAAFRLSHFSDLPSVTNALRSPAQAGRPIDWRNSAAKRPAPDARRQ